MIEKESSQNAEWAIQQVSDEIVFDAYESF